MATEAARLECKGIHRKERENRKRKTPLTHTGLLMEGVESDQSALQGPVCFSETARRLMETAPTRRERTRASRRLVSGRRKGAGGRRGCWELATRRNSCHSP